MKLRRFVAACGEGGCDDSVELRVGEVNEEEVWARGSNSLVGVWSTSVVLSALRVLSLLIECAIAGGEFDSRVGGDVPNETVRALGEVERTLDWPRGEVPSPS